MSPSRRTPRTGAGPGRGSPRTRTAARTGTRSATGRPVAERRPVQPTPSAEQTVPGEGIDLPARVRSVGITRRAVALLVVVGVLMLSYASSLRIYMNQQRDIATAQAEIAEHNDRIADLRDELDRWKDPAYVEAQARQRLGWVVPGETGYVVLGEDGQPIDGSAEIDSERADKEKPDADAWWARTWGSMKAADHPSPAPRDDTSKHPKKKPR